MQRTLGIVFVVAGLILVVMGFVASATDGAAMKYGAIIAGVVLAVVGVVMISSSVKPEPIVRTRNYKEPGKLDFDRDNGSDPLNFP